MTEINATQFVSVRQTITNDYRTAWQVVFAVEGVFSPECVIATHETKEHADDEAGRFTESLQRIIEALRRP